MLVSPSDNGIRAPPAQHRQPVHIELLLWGAIRLAGIPVDLALVAHDSRHRFSQLEDRQVHAHTHNLARMVIRTWLPVLQRKHTGLAKIIHMQELPQGEAYAPAGGAGSVGLSHMETATQCRQCVAVGGVVVDAWAMESGGHQAERIESILHPQRTADQDASDLVVCVPLVSGLQRAGVQAKVVGRSPGLQFAKPRSCALRAQSDAEGVKTTHKRSYCRYSG